MKKTIILIAVCAVAGLSVAAQYGGQQFQRGFNAMECDEMLSLNLAFLDTTKGNPFNDFLSGYRFAYRSPNMGLDNAWDLWIRADSTVTIVLRGTTADPKSILADFFCAMVPAQGSVIFAPGDTFDYHLASDKRAAVHAGFLVGFAFLAKDILPKLDSLYQKGFHNYLITGHSQGGSLSYFVSSWLLYLKKDGKYPLLSVKTYATAPAKVGNMYFVYDYDNITHAEWSFSVINSADPVPELPFTTQQVAADMNEPNPILNLYKRFDELPLVKRIILKHAFNKMRKKAEKSSKAYQKYLGGYSAKLMRKIFPGLSIPEPVNTTYFIRPGVLISLMANEVYFSRFASDNDGPYYHHGITPYRFLLREYYRGLAKLPGRAH